MWHYLLVFGLGVFVGHYIHNWLSELWQDLLDRVQSK
jgi:hypothetical protein